jgi:pantetheine-phosphate adenylyltransferase
MTTPLNPRHAAYVGSFDPLTLGHEDIVRRAAGIFDHVTVGIGINPEKRALLSPEERLSLTRTVLAPFRNVSVECFDGLAVDFVRRCGAAVMLRGLRTLTDIDAEFTMSLANRSLAPDIETIFLMAGAKYTHISSTLIKQVAQMGDHQCAERLKAFVPAPIIGALMDKFVAAAS